jgi:hypothetical protein
MYFGGGMTRHHANYLAAVNFRATLGGNSATRSFAAGGALVPFDYEQ